ncbi:MAG: hypothetical protein ABI599_02790 [Flavobacteriales bacterium]
MKNVKQIVLISTLALCSPLLQAQYECTDYHKFNCERSGDPRFSLNGQSRSAQVQVGVPTELNIIVYSGQDYRISLCFDHKVIGNDMGFRLIEVVREPRKEMVEVTEQESIMDANGQPTGETKDVKRMEERTVYEDVRKVVWDCSEHEMVQEIEFSCTSTKRLLVEVVAPGVPEDQRKGANKDRDIGCVGIMIEHMPTPNVGFEPQK